MPRPTKRGLGLAGGAAVLFVIGTNIQSGWLFVLASLLLGAMLAGLAVPPLMIGKVRVERHSVANVHVGEDIPVDVVVTNPGGRTLLSLSLDDRFISRSRLFLGKLSGHESVTLPTVRKGARRGIYEGEPVRISSQAPFGAAKATRKVAAEGRVVVLPRVVGVGWPPEMAAAAKPLQAAVVQARKGSGHDFIGIREYQHGDSLRAVHWPSTARHGSLMVREFEQELPRRMGILVDTSADSEPDAAGESTLDACCSVAASFAIFTLSQGHPLTMAAAAGDGMTSIEGVDDVEALTWLAGLRVGAGAGSGGRSGFGAGSGVVAPLGHALMRAAPVLGRIDTLIVAFATWKENDAEAILATLAAYEQVQPVAVMIDASAFPGTSGRTMSPESLAEAAATLDAAGVTVYRIPSAADLADGLERPP